ncbi:MAG: glycosyltransferase [Bacteroidetes bacterium]|nr:MAG: glycosyltransferase [Bacteroidota bacterium]
MWMLLLPLAAVLYHLWQRARLLRAWEGCSRPLPAAGPPLSVIIAARNEAPNLARYLPAWLSQAYPDYELILVLDRCTDESAAIALAVENPRLRVVHIDACPSDWAPKKWAVDQGIRAARHAHLVLMDADCAPEAGWLSEVGRHFAAGQEVVLGLGLYRQYPGWLNRLVQWETAYTAWQYVGRAARGAPYMAVGRNLAYTRAFYERAGGMARWRDRLSGDDDLLINAAAGEARLGLMTVPGSRTWSEPPRTWREWWAQKTRHVSASRAYSLRSQRWLGAFHGSHVLFYAGILLCLFVLPTAGPVFALYLGYAVTLAWLVRHLRRTDLPVPAFFLILDFLFFLYNISLVPIGLIKAPSWRNRNRKYPKTPWRTGSS